MRLASVVRGVCEVVGWCCGLMLMFFPGLKAGAQTVDIHYGQDVSQQVDICSLPPGKKPMPAVLMIHGGGWRSGSRKGVAGPCKTIALAGVVAVAVEYRLVTDVSGTTWPAQLNDVQLAMRFVRAHAKQLGVDPNHICAEGDSAGGQLALLLGILNTIEPGDTAGELPHISPKANCVISISGPTDMLSIETEHPHYADHLVGAGDASRMKELKLSASPALRAETGAAPALLVHGLDDPLVPFAQAVEMQEALKKVGTPVWLVSHLGGHELQGMTNDEVHAFWPFVAEFVKSYALGAPAGNVLPAKDVLP